MPAVKPPPFIPETIVDEGGYETDGMFRWGGPKRPLNEENLRKWVDDFNTDFQQTAEQRIASLRNHLTQFIQPFVDGPFTPEEAAEKKLRGRTHTKLNIPLGDGIYVLHKGLPKSGYWHDAIDAIHELDEPSKFVAKAPEKTNRIVRSAIHVGVLATQAQLRAIFAPEVLYAMKHRKAAGKGGKATRKLTDNIEELVKKYISTELRPGVSRTAACNRAAAKLHKDHPSIDIGGKTLMPLAATIIRENA